MLISHEAECAIRYEMHSEYIIFGNVQECAGTLTGLV